MGKSLPSLYDLAMKPLEKRKFRKIREALLLKARGRVLEIGAGTGVNFPLYQNVEKVDAIEPNSDMLKHANEKKASSSVPICFHQQSAETLNFPDNTFDSVVATLVFCSIPDPEKALLEIKRVSKPNAAVLFFEHVKMEQRGLALAQDFLTPLWKRLFGGCHLNRDTLQMIQQSGFQIKNVTSYYKGLFLAIESENEKHKEK